MTVNDRKIRILELKTNHALSKSGLPELDYALNPYLGCLHACIYCFAIDFTSEREARENWGSVVAVKTNLLETLRKEIIGKRRGIVGVSTITDPYQAIEGKYRLTRESIRMLTENGFRVSVQTKSPLVTRDKDIFANHRKIVDVGMTVTSLDPKMWTLIEPGSPPPISRVRALKILGSENISTWIFLGPVMKGLNDSRKSLEEVISAAAESGSRIIFDRFEMYNGASRLIQKAGLDLNPLSDASSMSLWWESTRHTIESLCESGGVTCTYQPDEWKYERSKNFGSLF
jgi:DNA repair photolyase